jgi:lipopolysaccharide export system protein LptA
VRHCRFEKLNYVRERQNLSVKMSISSVKIIRRILIGVICAVAISALVNYLIVAVRRPPGGDENSAPMISADFRRAAENVEVNVRKGSVLRFNVRARRLQETVQGGNFLEEIEASDFNGDGSVRNSIYSNRAVSDTGRGTLDFDGDVRVLLGDGTELRAETLHYDLNEETGDIPGKMEFRSSSVSGWTSNVRFFRDEDRLELGGGVDFLLPRENAAAMDGPGDAIRASAARGTCLLAENRILFFGGVRMESPDTGALSAEDVDIKLNNGRSKITYMTASGKTAYEMQSSGGARFISGERMVFTAGTTGALERALISGHANLLVKSNDAERTLRSGEIEMFMDPVTGAISAIRGTTGSEFKDRRGANETLAEGDEIYAAFADAGGRLRSVRLSGRSRFVRMETGKAANELLAEIIDARFQTENENIEVLTADGGVRWTFDPPGEDAARTMIASKLEIRYAGNYPDSGEASGLVTLEEFAAGRMTRRIKAERMRFDFFPDNGQIKSLMADGGARTVYERAVSSFINSGMERYETSSDSLEAFFIHGKGTGAVGRVEQRGNFRFISDGRSASADRGEYNADNGKLTLTGSPEIFDAAGHVSGDMIEYDTGSGELLARGRVRAVLGARQSKGALFSAGFQTGGGASPVAATAEELRYLTANERFLFTGGVMVMAENQQLDAREITIDGAGNMTAGGGVLHRIRETSAEAIIESRIMEYRRDEGIIRSSGNVEMKSKDLMLSTDVLNAALDDEAKDITRVLAEGHVFVRHNGRVCSGDAAEWIPASSSYVVTGNPAIIDDPARGRSTARRITYFQEEDRIMLEP